MELSEYGYICSAGETWDGIARALWRDEKYAADLLCVNPELCGKVVFTGGELLRLPVVEIPEEDDISALPVSAPWKEG